jgi:hypothetical protein
MEMLYKAPVINEPKRQNRFVLRFPSDLGINEWTVESAKRPSITQNPVEIPFLNTSTWVLGRYTWDDMNVTFRDMIGPSTAQALMEWVRLHSESVTGRQGYAAGYKRDIELEMLDPTGVVVEKWICKNCWITNLDNGELSYGNDALATNTATIKMDYAILVY